MFGLIKFFEVLLPNYNYNLDSYIASGTQWFRHIHNIVMVLNSSPKQEFKAQVKQM